MLTARTTGTRARKASSRRSKTVSTIRTRSAPAIWTTTADGVPGASPAPAHGAPLRVGAGLAPGARAYRRHGAAGSERWLQPGTAPSGRHRSREAHRARENHERVGLDDGGRSRALAREC